MVNYYSNKLNFELVLSRVSNLTNIMNRTAISMSTKVLTFSKFVCSLQTQVLFVITIFNWLNCSQVPPFQYKVVQKASCLYNFSYLTSSHEIASLGLNCCIQSENGHKMHSLLNSFMGMYGAFSVISFIYFIFNLVLFSALGVL